MTDEVDLGIPGIGPATQVGHGGFGTVYRAVQASFGGVVAVKVVAGHLDDTARVRFERETRALGSLRGHPNICTVFDAGVGSDGRPYIVMEYAPTTLAQRLADSGAMSWADATVLGVLLAGALHTAHVSGLLHRDVKPENVLIGSFGVPKLADFGLARFSDDTLSRGVTTTVSHAAPELLRGEPPSIASDVYALGSTLFAALTGHVAFALTDGAHHASLYRRIEEDPVPEMPGVPELVAAVVRTAMAKDPGERYPTVRAVGEAIREVQRATGEPVTTLPLADEEAVDAAVAAGAGAAEVETVNGATPRDPGPDGALTEAVHRENRGPVVVEEAAEETAQGRARRNPPPWALAGGAALAALLVAVAIALVGGDGGGGGGDAGNTTDSSTSRTEHTESSATTMAPNPPGRIEGNWSLVSARFSDSSFCDVDSCLPLESLSFTIDCSDFDSLQFCDVSVDDIASGFIDRTAGEGSWTTYLPDVQGAAQLLCDGEPVSTSLEMELEATGAQPVDGSAVTLEGSYRATIVDGGACAWDEVAYDIVMGR